MSSITKAIGLGPKQSGTTQTVQSSDPWSGVQPYLRNLFSRADMLYENGQTSGITNQARQLTAQRALAGSPLNTAAQAQTMKTLQGGYLNPYTQGALGDVMDMAKSKINAQFSGDNFGSSAHKEWLGRGLLSASMPFAQQAYEGERGRQMAAAGMAPALASQDYTDLGQLAGVGQQIDQAPWQRLSMFRDLISGQGGGTTTSSQPYYTNPGAELAGLGSTIAGLGMVFSDARLKTDIKKIGEKDGLGIYSYRYKGDDKPQVGVMAQEVLMKKPEAVHDVKGLLAVDYGAL